MKNMDTLQPFLIDKSNVRGRIVRLGKALNTIINNHNYPEPVNHCLADTIVMTTILAGMLKFEGILTVQIIGNGAMPALVVDITNDGAIRGYANVDHEKFETIANNKNITFKELVGNEGRMAFTVDQSATKERYQGLVALEGDNIMEWMRHYFKQSEQLQTGFKMAMDIDNAGTYQASAIMVQSLPQEESKTKSNINEDDWQRTMMLLNTVKDEELISDELSFNDVLFRLFHEDDVRVFEPITINHACRCSDDKVKNVLSTLSSDELAEININGMIETSCQFCSKRYHFKLEELKNTKGD